MLGGMWGWKLEAYNIFIQRNTYKQNMKYGGKCGKKSRKKAILLR
jgi:hypothetical protein